MQPAGRLFVTPDVMEFCSLYTTFQQINIVYRCSYFVASGILMLHQSNEIQQSYSEFEGRLLSCPHKQWLEFLPPSQCVFRLLSLPHQFMSRHVWMARVSGGLTLLLVQASPHKNLRERLLVAIIERTGCRFYGVPEHGSCHRTFRRMQMFYAIKLLSSGTR